MPHNALSCYNNGDCPKNTICHTEGTGTCILCSECLVLPISGCGEICGTDSSVLTSQHTSSISHVASTEPVMVVSINDPLQPNIVIIIILVIILLLVISISILLYIKRKTLHKLTRQNESFPLQKCSLCLCIKPYSVVQTNDMPVGIFSVGNQSDPTEFGCNSKESEGDDGVRQSVTSETLLLHGREEETQLRDTGTGVPSFGQVGVSVIDEINNAPAQHRPEGECIEESVTRKVAASPKPDGGAGSRDMESGGEAVSNTQRNQNKSSQQPSADTAKGDHRRGGNARGQRHLKDGGSSAGVHSGLKERETTNNHQRHGTKNTVESTLTGHVDKQSDNVQRSAPGSSHQSQTRPGSKSTDSSKGRLVNSSNSEDRQDQKQTEKKSRGNPTASSGTQDKTGMKPSDKTAETGGNPGGKGAKTGVNPGGRGAGTGDKPHGGAAQNGGKGSGKAAETGGKPHGGVSETGSKSGVKAAETRSKLNGKATKTSGNGAETVGKATERSSKPSQPSESTKKSRAAEATDENCLQLDLFSNVYIAKEEPRTEIGQTHRVEPEPVVQADPEREHLLAAWDEVDTPLSIQCTDNKQEEAEDNLVAVNQPPSARPPSVQVIDGGHSHRGILPPQSRSNDSGCGSVGGAVGGAQGGDRWTSLTPSEEFRKLTERHMAERGVDNQLAYPYQVADREEDPVVEDAQVREFEKMFPGFIHPSKQRNRWIYDQLKKIDWVMGYYSAGESIEVYVNLGSLDPRTVEQQLADITGADITKFHAKQNEEPEFDYNL